MYQNIDPPVEKSAKVSSDIMNACPGCCREMTDGKCYHSSCIYAADLDMFGSSPYDEINERLGYDADIGDSSQYCRHGTFIGSWWGPDYLCGACEAGQ